MVEPCPLRCEYLLRVDRELLDQRRVNLTPPHIVQRRLVDHVVLMACAQQRQEAQSGFRPACSEDGKALAANMGCYALAPRMTCAGIVDRDERRRDQARPQDRQVFACKHVEIRGQDANDLALRYLDPNTVEDRCQPFRRHLTLRMHGQTEVPQARTDAADNAIRQGRKNCLAVQGHPALAPVAHHLGCSNQFAHQDCFVALEA